MSSGMDDTSLIRQAMRESVASALREAESMLLEDEVADIIEIAGFAVRGVAVVRWRPPGPSAPLCPTCGRAGNWFQVLDSGVVKCRCELPN